MKRNPPELMPVKTSATTKAGFDLQISQTIPAEHLRAMRDAYTYMIKAIDGALAAKDQQVKRSERMRRHSAAATRRYNAQCIKYARANMRPDQVQRISNCQPDIARNMLANGRAMIKAAKSKAKKRHIIRLHLDGLGSAAIARIVKKQRGACSAPYVHKVINEYRERAQIHLPLPLTVVK
ncbi:MAG TPA: hypothetical protein VKA67_05225 [Verrucomicrobiae bacterium]|nr:hypothetical protein [Verrucomicrobiae bacterium]